MAMTDALTLTPTDIDLLPELPLGEDGRTSHRILWHDATSMAGVLTVPAGHRLGSHAHRENHHHMWVLTGKVRVLGRDLEPGSYVHVPAGVEHDIDATRTDGCTVFYLYLRPA